VPKNGDTLRFVVDCRPTSRDLSIPAAAVLRFQPLLTTLASRLLHWRVDPVIVTGQKYAMRAGSRPRLSRRRRLRLRSVAWCARCPSALSTVAVGNFVAPACRDSLAPIIEWLGELPSCCCVRQPVTSACSTLSCPSCMTTWPSCSLVRGCQLHSPTDAVENPSSSRLWLLPPLSKTLERVGCSSFKLDSVAPDAPCEKPRRILINYYTRSASHALLTCFAWRCHSEFVHRRPILLISLSGSRRAG
jgi:hypothetical protein